MPLIDCYRWVVPLVGCTTDGSATDLEGVLMGQGVQGEQATPNANPHLISLTIVCLPPFPFHSIPLTVDWLLLFAGAVVVRLFHKCYCLHTAIHIVTTAVVITTEKTTQSHAAALSARL